MWGLPPRFDLLAFLLRDPGFAQAWRSKAREAAYRNSITTGTHAPGPFRSETVRNQDPWYAAFDVKEGQARYLAPDKRVKIW